MYLVLNYTCSSHFHSVMYACFRILFHTPFICTHFISRFNPVKGSEIKHNIAFLLRLAKDDKAPSCSKLSEFPTRSEFSAGLEGGFGQVDLGRGGGFCGCDLGLSRSGFPPVPQQASHASPHCVSGSPPQRRA